MLSRVADSLYWMSRYLERAENVARFVDVNLHLCLDLPGPEGEQWAPLVLASGHREDFAARYGEPTRENVIRFLILDPDSPNSIYSCVASSRENARWIRQFITVEMWETLNRFYLEFRHAAGQRGTQWLTHDFLDTVVAASQMFLGVVDATMSRGEGWHFCRMGRMLERADKTSRILDVKYFHLLPSPAYVNTPYDDILWSAVLRSTSALEMYRKLYHLIQPASVVNFLVLDQEFPRAIHHCVTMAEQSVRAVSGTRSGTYRNRAERELGRLRADLDYANVEDLIESGLHEFLDGTQARLNSVGDAIFETFITLRPVDAAAENPLGGDGQ